MFKLIVYNNSTQGVQDFYKMRDHITASYTVSASRLMVPPCCNFKGVRNKAVKHLKDLPKSGLNGIWGLSVTP